MKVDSLIQMPNYGPQVALHDSTYVTPASCHSVCNGSAGIVVTGGTSPYHYHWQPTGDTTAAISHLCGRTYYVTVTDANNSTITDSVTIFAPVLDSIPITSDKYSFCTGDTAHLCAPVGFALYNWSNGDSATCIAAASSGNYRLTVTDTNGCTAVSNSLNISQYPVTSVSLVVLGDTLWAYSSNAILYQWFLNGNPIAGATSNQYIACQPGQYWVQVTDSNGCKTISNIPMIETDVTKRNINCDVGIDQLDENSLLNIYPNPSSISSWQLAVSGELVGSKMEIYNAEGQIVFQSEIGNPKSDISLNVAKGIYLLRIYSPAFSIVKKLIKL